MGYLGFGLQKWIYKQKPRKPFSNERKPANDTIQEYHNDFQLKKTSTYSYKKLKAGVTLIILGAIIWAAIIMLTRTKTHTLEYNKDMQETIEREKNESFEFLYNSGISRFNSRDWLYAKSEFELALKIKPNNIDLNKYYLSTLLRLSEKDSTYSELALEYINKKIQESQGNYEFILLKSQLINELNKKN